MSVDLSPAEALKMFEDQGREDEAVAENVETTAVKEPVDAPKQEAVQEPVVEATPEGVATKDGKHVIPYSVLQNERTRAAQAAADLEAARAEIAALKANLSNDPKQAAKTGGADTVETTQEELDRLAVLEEDFPTVAAELKAMRELVKGMESKLKPIEVSARNIEQRSANEAAMTVQEAIDNVPKMAHIQSSDPAAFDLAKQFDTALRDRPEWADKSMAERFEKVVELVEASRGVIEVPGAKKPSADPEALKKAAAAKLAEAPKAVPTSLTQFPAGTPAATDEASAIEAMSHTQLASKMARMTPKQLDAYFANL